MIQEVLAYKNVLQSIKELMDNSPYKKSYIIEKTGMSAATFYRKLKNLTFTADEVLKIAKLLRPEEAVLITLHESEKDRGSGRMISHEQAMEQLRKKYL